ncbi:hypothetical protein ACHAXR_006930 [Thalassiosira sp. AJA248-18]
MDKKTDKASELTIESLEWSPYRIESRLMPNWKAIPLWCVILSSLFTVSEGAINHAGGRKGSVILPWKNNPYVLSRSNTSLSGSMSAASCDKLDSISAPSSQSKGSTKDSTLIGITNNLSLRGGALGFPAGYNPFGYGLTDFGKQFLDFDGSLDSDVGRFLSTLKGGNRKTAAVMKEQWLEIVRVSKKAQSMRIYRKLDDMIEFCLKAGFID